MVFLIPLIKKTNKTIVKPFSKVLRLILVDKNESCQVASSAYRIITWCMRYKGRKFKSHCQSMHQTRLRLIFHVSFGMWLFAK